MANGAAIRGPAREGLRRFGVPPGGPFDLFSAADANRQVGAPADAPTLELLNAATEFLVLESGALGLSGGRFLPSVTRDGQETWFDGRLIAGDRLTLTPGSHGARLYISAPGGWNLDAASEAVGPGSEIASRDPDRGGRSAGRGANALHLESLFARWSPNFAWTSAIPEVVHGQTLPQSDRRGVRIQVDAPPIEPTQLRSQPQCVGAIEWTPSGEWIVIGPDGPTVGGYPRIGWIVRSSMPTVAQALPGERLNITFVTADAEARLNARFDAILTSQ